MDFKLIPAGDKRDVSLRNTLHFLKLRALSRVKKDLEITVNFVFISLKSWNKEMSAVVKCARSTHSFFMVGFRFSSNNNVFNSPYISGVSNSFSSKPTKEN